jgi:hypothetical protein
MRAWLNPFKRVRQAPVGPPAGELPGDAELLAALIAELQAAIERRSATPHEWKRVAHQLRRTAQLLEATARPRRPRSFDPAPVTSEGRLARRGTARMAFDAAPVRAGTRAVVHVDPVA